MDVYQPGLEADAQLVLLWRFMLESGDLGNFPDELSMLSCFLRTMQPPTTLYLERDDTGPWFAFWVEPNTLPFAIVSLWVRGDHRQSLSGIRAVHEALRRTFEEHETIIGYIGDEKLAATYEHFGLGRHTPDIYIGERRITLFSFTRDQYRQSLRRSA